MAGIMQAFCNAEEKVNFHSQGGASWLEVHWFSVTYSNIRHDLWLGKYSYLKG